MLCVLPLLRPCCCAHHAGDEAQPLAAAALLAALKQQLHAQTDAQELAVGLQHGEGGRQQRERREKWRLEVAAAQHEQPGRACTGAHNATLQSLPAASSPPQCSPRAASPSTASQTSTATWRCRTALQRTALDDSATSRGATAQDRERGPTHLDVVPQRLRVPPLLQNLHGLPKGADAGEHQPLRRRNVRGALHLRQNTRTSQSLDVLEVLPVRLQAAGNRLRVTIRMTKQATVVWLAGSDWQRYTKRRPCRSRL